MGLEWEFFWACYNAYFTVPWPSWERSLQRRTGLFLFTFSHPLRLPAPQVRFRLLSTGRPGLSQPATAQRTGPLNESDSRGHEYVWKKTTQHLNLTPTKFNFTWGAISFWPLIPCPDVSLIQLCAAGTFCRSVTEHPSGTHNGEQGPAGFIKSHC